MDRDQRYILSNAFRMTSHVGSGSLATTFMSVSCIPGPLANPSKAAAPHPDPLPVRVQGTGRGDARGAAASPSGTSRPRFDGRFRRAAAIANEGVHHFAHPNPAPPRLDCRAFPLPIVALDGERVRVRGGHLLHLAYTHLVPSHLDCRAFPLPIVALDGERVGVRGGRESLRLPYAHWSIVGLQYKHHP